jgi:hypothetical protein
MLRFVLFSIFFHVIISAIILYSVELGESGIMQSSRISVRIISNKDFKSTIIQKKKEVIKKSTQTEKSVTKTRKIKPKKIQKTKVKEKQSKKPKSKLNNKLPLKENDNKLEGILEEFHKIEESHIPNNDKKLNHEYTSDSKLSFVELTNIKRQVKSCWRNITSKLFNKDELKGLKVIVRVSLDEEGRVTSYKLIESRESYMDVESGIYRKFSQSALDSFKICNRINDLPKDRYKHWEEFDFVFSDEMVR